MFCSQKSKIEKHLSIIIYEHTLPDDVHFLKYGHYGTKSFYNKFDDVRRVNAEPPFAPPHDEPHEPHGPRR